MVLVGEPTRSLESAAFTFLLPSGCSYDPATRSGLASLTCEMMLRGAGSRDSRAWVSDLENLGVERGESVGVAQATFTAATLRDNLPAGARDCLQICCVSRICRPISWRRAGARACRNCGPSTTSRVTS